jgi:hypothetical protein
MLQLSETGGTLVIFTPLWVGVLAMAVGGALLLAIAWRRRIDLIAAGGVFACLVFSYAGWDLMHSSATLHPAGVVVDGAFGEVGRVGWSQVDRWEVDDRPSARGRSKVLALRLRSGDEITIRIGGLSDAETVRVLDFVKGRAKKA